MATSSSALTDSSHRAVLAVLALAGCAEIGLSNSDGGVDGLPGDARILDLSIPDLTTPERPLDLALDRTAEDLIPPETVIDQTVDVPLDLAQPDFVQLDYLSPPDFVQLDYLPPPDFVQLDYLPPPDLTPAHCGDGQKSLGETDRDCGGPECGPCDVDKACLAASDCQTGVCTSNLCVLASGPPYWLSLSPMASAMGAGCSGATMPGGEAYALGGWYFGFRSNVDRFSNGSWIASTSMPTGRANFGTVASPTKLYVVGGEDDSAPLDTVITWSGTSWSIATTMPGTRTFGAAALLGNTLYAIGGVRNSSLVAAVDSWPIGGAWQPGSSTIPTPRKFLGATVGADNRIYAIGGYDGTAVSRAVEAYDGTGWTTMQLLPTPREYLSVTAAPDGRIYAIGGDSDGTTLLASVAAYTPATDSWVAVADLVQVRNNHCSTLAPDGRILLFGGFNGGFTGSVEAYGPVISLNTSSGAVGSSVKVTGMNFAANATVNVYFDAQLVGSGATNGPGVITGNGVDLTVPAVASGPHLVKVVDSRSRYPVTARFTIP